MEIVLLEVKSAAVVCSVVRESGEAAIVTMAFRDFPVPGPTFGFGVRPEQLGLTAAEFPAVDAAARELFARRASTPIGTRVSIR